MTDIALQIACCIERARLESGFIGNWPDPDVEIYWYTREASVDFSRKLGVRYFQVVLELQKIRQLLDVEIYKLSELFWPQLAHPDLIIKEVMGS
jgi:hypothetical protein